MTAPFTALDFRVEILPPGASAPLCGAAFAECDGLELRLDVRTLREGGDNGRQRLLAGPASYGQVTLRRGMTESLDLWDWCASVLRDPSVRADARVVMLAPDGDTVQAAFRLSRCLPVRLRAPRLDAREGIVAIEELQLACESLQVERPGRRPDPRTPLERAELVDPSGKRVVVQVNPASLHVSRDANGATLAFALTMEAPAGGDVRSLSAPISELAAAERARFAWGAFRFEGRLTAVEEQLDLFSADGRPLRSSLTLTMRSADTRGPAQ
jgi:phage tail-like protein